VMAVMSSDGTTVEKIKYDPYGEATVALQDGQSATGNPYLFQGRRWDDEVSLYYFRNRVMSPVLGRFLQRDPVGNRGDHTLYCFPTPTVLKDPMGLCPAGYQRLTEQMEQEMRRLKRSSRKEWWPATGYSTFQACRDITVGGYGGAISKRCEYTGQYCVKKVRPYRSSTVGRVVAFGEWEVSSIGPPSNASLCLARRDIEAEMEMHQKWIILKECKCQVCQSVFYAGEWEATRKVIREYEYSRTVIVWTGETYRGTKRQIEFGVLTTWLTPRGYEMYCIFGNTVIWVGYHDPGPPHRF